MLVWVRELRNLQLFRFSDIKEKQRLICVKFRFQVLGRDENFVAFWNFSSSQPTKLLVVNQLSDGRVIAADGAVGVSADFDSPELHPQSVNQHHLADERFSYADNQLDGFRCLKSAHNARQNAQNAPFSATGDCTRRRRGWE